MASGTAANVAAHADKIAEHIAALPHFEALAPVESLGRELVGAWIQVAHGEVVRSRDLLRATDDFLDVSSKVTHTPDVPPPADWQP